jgi:trypsin
VITREGKTKRLRATAIAFASGLVLALSLAPAATADDANASIVGGTATPITELPWLTYIEANEGLSGFACSGSVIAPRVILTAAHCADSLEEGRLTPPRDYGILVGIADHAHVGPAAALEVVETHVFPGFDPGTLHGDAALLVLADPVPIAPLPLAGPGDAALYEGGAGIRLAGWGLTSGRARKPPTALRSASLVVQPGSFCQRKTHDFYPEYSPSQQLCAVDIPDHKSGGCFGDSGGPGIGTRPDGSPVELGIISTGGPECNPKLPNVLTRVDLVSSWAAEWIAAIETGAPPPAVDNSLPLPRMSKESGEVFAIFTLFENFSSALDGAKRIDGSCQRQAATRFKCRIRWLSGHFSYSGAVSPFYLRQRGAVIWHSHFQFKWVDLRCKAARKHCPVHSRHN